MILMAGSSGGDSDWGSRLSTISIVPMQDAVYRGAAADQGRITEAISAERRIRYSLAETDQVFGVDGPLTAAIEAAEGSVLIVVDAAVWETSAAEIEAYFGKIAATHRILVLSGGEASKGLDGTLDVIQAMDECKTLRRSTPVVAIGGGVVCDLVGFAASIYRRGVPYYRVPTTLLSQVDVSVAIKTGVNHGGFRNRIGTFWPPELTVIDRRFLATQSKEHLSQGLGEVFKLALIKSEPLFELLEHIPRDWEPSWLAQSEAAAQIMRLAIREMADDLRDNLWEENLARCVDFGHSFSPIFEMRTGVHHGHAVALDCLLTSCIAAGRGLLDPAQLSRIVAVMRRCELPTSNHDFADTELLWESFTESMRHRDGHQHLPTPKGIGNFTFIEDLERAELDRAMTVMRRVAG